MHAPIDNTSIPEPERPTNTAGRHPLPNKRLNPQNQQPHAASSAVPGPQSAAMEWRISTSYINEADPSPYRSTAEADKDRGGAIAMVNSGRQSNNSEHPRQHPGEFPSRYDTKGSLWSPRDHEGAEILAGLRSSSAAARALPTPKASKSPGASAGVDTNLLPPSSNIEPKRKRIRGGAKREAKKAKISGNWKAEAGPTEEGEPQKEKAKKEKPCKCNICGKGFARPDHVKRHVATQHNREREMFQCDLCFSLHSRRDNLRPHRKTHKPDSPEPEPHVWLVVMDENGEMISRRRRDQPALVTVDGGAQVGEGEVDTIDSPAQPVPKAQASEPGNSRTTTETRSRWTSINKPMVRV